jgi:hypothetical protein
MVAASDGPRKPIPETTWVKATTAGEFDRYLNLTLNVVCPCGACTSDEDGVARCCCSCCQGADQITGRQLDIVSLLDIDRCRSHKRFRKVQLIKVWTSLRCAAAAESVTAAQLARSYRLVEAAAHRQACCVWLLLSIPTLHMQTRVTTEAAQLEMHEGRHQC